MTRSGIRLGVGQRQRGAPGAAEQQPAVDAEMAAQGLDVGDQVLGGVVLQAAERTRPAGAALVEDDHAPELGVEEAAMHRAGAGARAAVQEQHRPAARVADLLPVHDMAGRERQVAGLERADLGEQVAAWHGAGWYRRRARSGTGSCGMQRTWIALGALAGLTAVAMAALAAHGLAGWTRRRWRWCGARSRCRAGTRWRWWPAGCGRRAAAGWRTARGRPSCSASCCSAARSMRWRCGGVRVPVVPPVGGTLLMLGWLLLGLSALLAPRDHAARR